MKKGLFLLVIAVLSSPCSLWAQDPTESTFFSFPQTVGSDCGISNPQDPLGNLNSSATTFYGVTEGSSCSGAGNLGSVYTLTTAGVLSVLWVATSADVASVQPHGRPIVDATGNVYFVAAGGSGTCGAFVKLNSSGAVVYEYKFLGSASSDGCNPQTLARDSAGTVYVNTYSGGTGTACGGNGCGTVAMFKTSGSSYTESIIHNFAGGTADGSHPQGEMALGNGLAYANESGDFLTGTTFDGGASGLGIVWNIQTAIPGDPVGYAKWHDFSGGTTDGQDPVIGLYAGQYGSPFFGLTAAGGTNGTGTFYSITPNAVGASYALIQSFTGTTGSNPVGSLVADSNGNFYLGLGSGNGSIAKEALNQTTGAWTLSTKYSFTGGTDGGTPIGGLVFSGTKLYGVTEFGGSNTNCGGHQTCGAAFSVTTP